MTTMNVAPQLVPRRRHFTVEEFLRLAEVGILHEDDRVELLVGEIIEMAAIGIPHANAVTDLNDLAAELVGGQVHVSVQNPIQLDRGTLPRPDITLVRRGRTRRSHPTPADILLVIEVADSSLGYDRSVKLPLYAAAGVPEAWLIDLNGKAIERHGEPHDGRYTQIRIVGPGETLASPVLPTFSIPVAAILGEMEG